MSTPALRGTARERLGGGLRSQLIGLGGIVERNSYLIKRYGWWELAFFIWTVANTPTVVFIAKGVSAGGGHLDVECETTTLLIGAVIWAYLGVIFEILTETAAWERWEGTIEYTFMAPLSRAAHLGGWACLPCSKASSAPRCCSSSWRCSSACISRRPTSARRCRSWPSPRSRSSASG